MKEEIKVPAMGESITEATIGQIITDPGSYVKAEDELLELETDKVTQVLYAPKSGTFHLDVEQDDNVKIGDVIGHIDTDGAPAKEKKEEPKEKKEQEPEKEKEQEPEKEPEPKEPEDAEEPARLTKEAYLEDVSAPQPAAPPATPPKPKQKEEKQEEETKPQEKRRETRRKLPKIRQTIAKRLVQAQQQTAMLTTFNEVDMEPVMQLRSRYKEEFVAKHGVKLGFMSFFVKAAVSALQAFPDVNSSIEGDEIVKRWYYDISIAVGTEKGLIVPVIRDCDSLSFAQIEESINNYAEKARKGAISVDDLQGGCFTITNGGIYGSLLSTPILNAPQSGILGMHKIEKRPVVIDDAIVIKPMMYLALSYDHRIVDGKEAVSFLVHMKNILEDPGRLLLEV